jgi:hypothetical protein
LPASGEAERLAQSLGVCAPRSASAVEADRRRPGHRRPRRDARNSLPHGLQNLEIGHQHVAEEVGSTDDGPLDRPDVRIWDEIRVRLRNQAIENAAVHDKDFVPLRSVLHAPMHRTDARCR